MKLIAGCLCAAFLYRLSVCLRAAEDGHASGLGPRTATFPATPPTTAPAVRSHRGDSLSFVYPYIFNISLYPVDPYIQFIL